MGKNCELPYCSKNNEIRNIIYSFKIYRNNIFRFIAIYALKIL